jgi:hypothetical protein
MRRLAGALAVLALVVTGCGGTSSGAGAGGADIVPADATMFIALNTDADSGQWRTADNLASRFPDKQDGVKAVKQALRDEGLDWERDVKPALGPESDFVWLDLENEAENFVVITQPKDQAKFDNLISKAEESSDDIFRDQVGDWEVLGPSREVVATFRRESESSDSKLSDNNDFNDAMSSYPEDSLFRGYLNGRQMMDLSRRELTADERKTFDKLGSLDWVAASLRATSEGIRFDMNFHGKAGPALKGIAPTQPFRPSLTKEVPRDALFYATFHGAKGMLTGLENNPFFSDTPEIKHYSNVLRRVGSLLQGENAFYVRPGPSGKIPEVTFVTEPAPGTNGAATLDRILARYRSELDLPSQPKPTRVAGLPGRKIELGSVDVYYANVGGRLVITDFQAGVRALKGNSPSLEQSDEYAGAVGSSGMPAKTEGFFYVNVRGGISYGERLANTPLPEGLKRNLRPLRSAVEYVATRSSEVQITFFLRIK